MIHPIPTIVVVDSEKTPEDQLRTMIILFRPTDSDIIKYSQSVFVPNCQTGGVLGLVG